jgi:hypothetical protein
VSPRAQLHFAITFLLALAACAPGLVTPPPPAKDALPIITVGYADITGLGPVPPTNPTYTCYTTTIEIDMPLKATNHQIALWATAHNPGGVKYLRLSVNTTDTTSLTVAPDANGQVPPTIGIVGSDGAGAPGDQKIIFQNTGANVVVATATNFNNRRRTSRSPSSRTCRRDRKHYVMSTSRIEWSDTAALRSPCEYEQSLTRAASDDVPNA